MLALGNVGLALTSFRIAAREDPNSVDALAGIAASYDQMGRYADQVQARLLPMVGQGAVRSLITRVPGGFGQSDDFNSASFVVFLRPWEERTRTTAEVASAIQPWTTW